jgi:hypothetical protein
MKVQRWDGIYKIRSPHTKREGPDGLIHEGWCAIFTRDCCSCRDEGRRSGPRRRPRGPGPTDPSPDPNKPAEEMMVIKPRVMETA